MLDVVIYFLLKYAYVLAILLFVVKTVLFVKNRNRNWRLTQFLYFNPTNIQLTSKPERAKLKRLQNQLSIAIVIFLVLQIGVRMLFK